MEATVLSGAARSVGALANGLGLAAASDALEHAKSVLKDRGTAATPYRT